MRSGVRLTAALLTVGLTCVAALAAQQVTRETVAGVRNFARLETTVACTGALNPAEAMPAIKKLGFASVINLQLPTETGVNVDAERAAAEAAGLRYFHVPFNGTAPEVKSADQFLAAIATPGAQPALIHCTAGNRAAAMWLVKRLVVDRWETDRATKEAAELGLTSATLRQFAIDYAQAHKGS